MDEITYSAVEAALLQCHTLMSAAEAHGTLTGMICSGAEISCQQWMGEIFDEGKDSVEMPIGSREILLNLFEETRVIIEQESFEFDLLLPDDGLPLAERATSFGEWCRGFLYGIGACFSTRTLSDECDEVLRDISEISRLDSNVEGEEDENAFMELTEYVRVGVQLVHDGIYTRKTLTETFH